MSSTLPRGATFGQRAVVWGARKREVNSLSDRGMRVRPGSVCGPRLLPPTPRGICISHLFMGMRDAAANVTLSWNATRVGGIPRSGIPESIRELELFVKLGVRSVLLSTGAATPLCGLFLRLRVHVGVNS